MIEHGAAPDEISKLLQEAEAATSYTAFYGLFQRLKVQLEAALGELEELRKDKEHLEKVDLQGARDESALAKENDKLKAELEKAEIELQAVKRRGAVILESGTKMVDEVRSLKAELNNQSNRLVHATEVLEGVRDRCRAQDAEIQRLRAQVVEERAKIAPLAKWRVWIHNGKYSLRHTIDGDNLWDEDWQELSTVLEAIQDWGREAEKLGPA